MFSISMTNGVQPCVNAEHRRPSTSTLAAEKAALASETTPVEPISEAAAPLSMPSALPALIANAVADAMVQSRRMDEIAAAQPAFTRTGSAKPSWNCVPRE